MKCFYVAVGQKESTVAGVIERSARHGAMDYTTVIVAGASAPAPLQYVAPYAGTAMAEVLHVQRRARPDRVRRLVEASRRPIASCRC